MIRRVTQWLRRHREDERGAVLVLTSIALIAVLGAGAMGVDLGFSVVGSRTAQAMADTAALDLAQDITTANQFTTNAGMQSYLNSQLAGVLKDNGSNAQLHVTFGLSQGGAWSVPSGGCASSTPPCNSVAVSAKQSVPQPFWGGFNNLAGKNGSGISVGSGCGSGGSGGCGMGCSGSPCFSCPIGGCTTCPTTGCATSETLACFSIGSDLANVNTKQSALLNALLTELGGTGSSVNLTALGYEGLASTSVSLGQLIAASGGVLSPSNILTGSVSAAQLVSFLTTAVNDQTSAGTCSSGQTTQQQNAENALNQTAGNTLSLTGSGSTSLQLCSLVSVNGSSCANASLPFSSLSAGVNVLQMLTTAAELANGTSGLNVDTILNLGIAGATLDFQSVQPAQVAYGPVGSYTLATNCPAVAPATSTCAHTAQVQAELKLNVLGVGLLDLKFSAADGNATLAGVTCTNGVMTSTAINAATTVAQAQIPGLLGILPNTTVTVGGASSASETYAGSVVPPSSSTTTAGTNPILLGTTTPTVTYSPAIGLLSPVNALLNTTLAAVLGPTLQALGVSTGGAAVTDLGTDCNSVQLT
jgi:uncharacterized membrane protein